MDACRIEIIGESNLSDWTPDEVARSRETRRLYDIKPLQLGKNGIDRYIIGYITVLYIDQSKLGMENILKEQNLRKIAQSQDEIDTFEFMQKVQLELQKSKKKPVQIGLIDRMYVGKAFRQNKVGGWILDNLREMVEFTSRVKLDAFVLEAGDFANEAESTFKMSREQYVVKYLEEFYKKHGFKKYKEGGLLGMVGMGSKNEQLSNYMILKF